MSEFCLPAQQVIYAEEVVEEPAQSEPQVEPAEPTQSEPQEEPSSDIIEEPSVIEEIPDVVEYPDVEVVDDEMFEVIEYPKIPDKIIDDANYSGPSYRIKSNGDGTVTVRTGSGRRYTTVLGAELSTSGVPTGKNVKSLDGDVNGDGQINIDDATTLNILLDIIGDGTISKKFDFNADNKVDKEDVKYLILHNFDAASYPIKDKSLPGYFVEGKAAISNCGFNEIGGIFNGKAGDQTGNEYRIQQWKDKGWIAVFRYEGDNSEMVHQMIASLSIAAARNDKIGYDQGGSRTSFWYLLKKFNYNPANITSACEADCSASTAAIIKAVGCILGIKSLVNVSADMCTMNERDILSGAGFKVLTDEEYLKSPANLRAGDILLKDGHTCIVASDGASVVRKVVKEETAGTVSGNKKDDKKDTIDKIYSTVTENVELKSKSESAKALQKALNILGYTNEDGEKLKEDGSFGKGSIYALTEFQRSYKINEPLGTCAKGGETWVAILALILRPDMAVQVSDVGNSFSEALMNAGVSTAQ